MPLFRRRPVATDTRPFWEVPPSPSRDPQIVQSLGMDAMTDSDGPGMIQAGWALWGLVGLDQRQAYDFIYDGHREWRNAGGSAQERAPFVLAVFRRLRHISPEISPTLDLATIPQSVGMKASCYYGARCWAGSELLELAPTVGMMTPDLEEDIFAAFAATHLMFLPPRTMAQYRQLRLERGLPDLS